jgi:hypothetical protein
MAVNSSPGTAEQLSSRIPFRGEGSAFAVAVCFAIAVAFSSVGAPACCARPRKSSANHLYNPKLNRAIVVLNRLM